MQGDEIMNTFQTRKYHDFTIYSCKESFSFMHIDLADSHNFYIGLFEYFFSETRLLKYAENKSNLTFQATAKNYATLFKHLGMYIDDFNISKIPSSIEDEVIKILADEYTLEDHGDGNLNVRLDKMGKIGEYIFCNLLSEYFGFDCIIPKVHLTTDPNMNVYGIDTLFYSRTRDTILLGESKLSKSLENGVGLINKSLKTYEQQIKDEFSLMLSNRFLKSNMGIFGDLYSDVIELSLSMEDFIVKANIKTIGIPIFIAHGSNILPNDVFKELDKIKCNKMLGIETVYIIVSLPIFNKSKMVSVFTQAIAARRAHYENEIAKL